MVWRMMSRAWSHGMSFEAQREAAALHRVARDDVEAGEVRDDLQHGPHFDVLEVKRELLALVTTLRALREACSGPREDRA